LIEDAQVLEKCGCFGIVLEKIPANLAKKVTKSISIPTIGIGAGPDVDGQVLVMQDMFGISKEFKPRFLRRYADLHTVMTDAVIKYIADVKSKDFPNESEKY
jgi:3-methyl-2-oxobutanoate hydroxymethyltransferase